jgi:imidazole glycerol-phosphate synthase subunit HisH
MKVAILKYNGGNIRSVECALRRLGVNPYITDDFNSIKEADRVIFPGVGEASSTMSYLKERKLDLLIKDLKQPFLGVCLGMQLLGSFTDENSTQCLQILDGVQCKRFSLSGLKVPHMGWNKVFNLSSPLFKGIPEGSFFYFVHSYLIPESQYSIGVCDYGERFISAVNKDNFYGVQFHPEKSHLLGEKVLSNFLQL